MNEKLIPSLYFYLMNLNNLEPAYEWYQFAHILHYTILKIRLKVHLCGKNP
jgi:hypothetical protein